MKESEALSRLVVDYTSAIEVPALARRALFALRPGYWSSPLVAEFVHQLVLEGGNWREAVKRAACLDYKRAARLYQWAEKITRRRV